jgi:hypothetical protein
LAAAGVLAGRCRRNGLPDFRLAAERRDRADQARRKQEAEPAARQEEIGP